MPIGASAKREREYEELKHKFKEEGRYKGRQEEIASRNVNKQRSDNGETKVEKKKDREGKSPDSGLPIRNYQHKTVGEDRSKLRQMDREDIKKLERYEKKHENRKTLLEASGQLIVEIVRHRALLPTETGFHFNLLIPRQEI